MKTLIYIFIASILPLQMMAQTNDSLITSEIISFQKELNAQYQDEAHSPLTKKDLKTFNGHHFFDVNLDYCINARFELTPESDTFGMKTSTDRRPLYKKYGIAYFSMNGVDCQLSIYQNIKYSQIEGHENSLFLLFNDLTNGNETYAGGRYIDLEKPVGNEIEINFNLAYNPYCHYNSKYSCPIPPEENNLPIPIKAGVKKFEGASSH